MFKLTAHRSFKLVMATELTSCFIDNVVATGKQTLDVSQSDGKPEYSEHSDMEIRIRELEKKLKEVCIKFIFLFFLSYISFYVISKLFTWFGYDYNTLWHIYFI